MKNLKCGFTLIELLVVIAILAAILRPSVSAANDRANISICQSNLEQIHLALRQYVEDHGRMPATLEELVGKRYLLDAEILDCVKTGKHYFYHPVSPDSDSAQIIAACVSPSIPADKRPHGLGGTYIYLRLNGKTAVAR